jgi:nitric oxide dioxygenase
MGDAVWRRQALASGLAPVSLTATAGLLRVTHVSWRVPHDHTRLTDLEIVMRLSDKSRPFIEATLPAVGEDIEEIAKHFYRHLFTVHPELLDGTFNRGNQAQGTQQQALAGSVAAFASALVNTPDHLPETLLARVAHKHASLGIQPDQYQVVHDSLMWAIADVLGVAVTPDVAVAWDEVYWLMADALIHTERGLYSARAVNPQTVWRRWEVVQKIPETGDVMTFVVKRIDDRLVKPSLPGQYITVQVPLPDGTRQPRQYSLSRADDGKYRQFTVKRVHGGGNPDGEVSTLLHDTVNVGDVLAISVPSGAVVLDDYSGRPMVFASAGIGITPMAGMLSHLVKAGSRLPVMLLHADLNEDCFALRRQVLGDITALPSASVYVWYEQGAVSQLPVHGVFPGEMDISQVSLPDNALFQLCGPIPFMNVVHTALTTKYGVPACDIQYEVFGPDLWHADCD